MIAARITTRTLAIRRIAAAMACAAACMNSTARADQRPSIDAASAASAAKRVVDALARRDVRANDVIDALLNRTNESNPIRFTDTVQPASGRTAAPGRRIGPTPRSVSLLQRGFVASAPSFQLPALGTTDVVDPMSQPLRVGRVADVSISSQVHGRWTPLADGGRLWTLSVSSPNAASLRLRISPFDPPRGAELITWNASDPRESYGPITSQRARPGLDYWTQTCFNSTVNIEYYLPPNVQGDHHLTITGVLLGFKLDSATVQQNNDVGDEGGLAGSGNCRIDVMCDNDWLVEANGVAHIAVIVGQSGFVCGGAMANRLPAFDSTPYFFAATHCVDNPDTANSIDVFWLWQNDQCGGEAPPLNTVPRTDGGVLLAMAAPADYTLLGLTIDDIPAGLSWLGWTTEPPVNPAPAVEIHHPAGLKKAISYGVFEGADSPYWTCAPNIQVVNRFNLDNGGQENGSSGGPIMTVSDHRIRGHASCSEVPGFICAPSENAWAGSFAAAYPSLSHFLNAPGTVWVTPSYGGQQFGTQSQPWNDLLIGRYGVPGNGTIMLAAGSYPAQTIAGGQKRYVIRSVGGSVVFE